MKQYKCKCQFQVAQPTRNEVVESLQGICSHHNTLNMMIPSTLNSSRCAKHLTWFPLIHSYQSYQICYILPLPLWPSHCDRYQSESPLKRRNSRKSKWYEGRIRERFILFGGRERLMHMIMHNLEENKKILHKIPQLL